MLSSGRGFHVYPQGVQGRRGLPCCLLGTCWITVMIATWPGTLVQMERAPLRSSLIIPSARQGSPAYASWSSQDWVFVMQSCGHSASVYATCLQEAEGVRNCGLSAVPMLAVCFAGGCSIFKLWVQVKRGAHSGLRLHAGGQSSRLLSCQPWAACTG